MAAPARSSRSDVTSALPLAAAVVVGAILRLIPPILAKGFPAGDGGLFASMARDWAAAGLIPPPVASYNGAGIPFAYPPAGIGVLAAGTAAGIDPLAIERWVPALFATGSIVAVYLIVRAALQSDITASAAALLFAISPNAIAWFVIGGGIARAPGQLLCLLTIWRAVAVSRGDGSRRAVAWLGVMWGLTALTHPEAALFAASGSAAAWLTFGRSRRTLLAMLAAAGLGIVVASPWWLTVLVRYGPTPLLSAATSRGAGPGASTWAVVEYGAQQLLTPDPLWWLAYVGLGIAIVRRMWFPIVWLALAAITPGDTVSNAAAPVALLAALGPAVLVGWLQHRRDWGKVGGLVVLAMSAALCVPAALPPLITPQYPILNVSQADLAAMNWVKSSTPKSASFIVLDAGNDSLEEWFPEVTQRTSVLSYVGTEWLASGVFRERFQRYFALRECGDLSCLSKAPPADNLWISRVGPGVKNAAQYTALIRQVQTSGRFALIYDGPAVLIYRSTSP